MRDYDISIRISRSSTRRATDSPRHCEWPCAFCNGTGRDPAGILGTENCRGCGGIGRWEADVSCDRLLPCRKCRGNGGFDRFGRLTLCDACHGSGKG